MAKALAEGTPGAGGYLVESEVADEVLRLLRARSAVMQLGPTVVSVKKELLVTSIASGTSAFWVAENAAIPPSEPTFSQTPVLRPKELAALPAVSNRLLRDAAEVPDIEEVLRSDLAEVLALRADLAFLQGTGGAEPTAIVEMRRVIDAHEVDLAKVRPESEPTFDHAATDWLHRLEHVDGVKPSTLSNYRQMLTRADTPARKRGRRTAGRIMAEFGGRELRSITAGQVERFLERIERVRAFPELLATAKEQGAPAAGPRRVDAQSGVRERER